MIKDNQANLNRLHIVLDALVIALSYMLAWYIRIVFIGTRELQNQPPIGVLPMDIYFRALYFLIPGYLVLYSAFNLYTPKRATKLTGEIASIIKANIVGMLGVFVVLFIIKMTHFSRGMITIFFAINIILGSISRITLRKILRYFRAKGYNLKHIMLVGYSRAAEAYVSRVTENPQWGYSIAGILDDNVPVGTSYHGIKVLGKISELQNYLDNNNYDEITITLPLDAYDMLEELVALCEKSGVHTKFIPDYTSLFPSNPYTEDVQGLAVINIRYIPLASSFNKFIKRLMDIVGSLVAMVVFSPFMLFAVIGIKATSKGPIIFKQERVGLQGKKFMMYKFRTMEVQSESQEKKGWTTKNDPRVTKFGRFLRHHSIDEMPQVFNILKGDMSLIGPRPERPQFVEKFKEQIPRYMVKHQVRPGLTGWAQINGYRGDTSIRKRIDYDIYYIENWSIGFDLKILVGTLGHGFVNKNAY
ncbi:MAG: undecaprenyl-phosphate glucose phosphotransferase [Butyrivibrio sp.]|nr:undecaprenyl-phosphate glucose phosphotransferase [Butyrivibrio sp.]